MENNEMKEKMAKLAKSLDLEGLSEKVKPLSKDEYYKKMEADNLAHMDDEEKDQYMKCKKASAEVVEILNKYGLFNHARCKLAAFILVQSLATIKDPYERDGKLLGIMKAITVTTDKHIEMLEGGNDGEIPNN